MQHEGSPVSVRLLGKDDVLPLGSSGLILGNITATPLTLDDWLRYEKGHTLKVKIRGRVEAGSDFLMPGTPPLGSWVEKALQLDPRVGNESICLVEGGWLPLIYSLAGTNIFTDRNIVSEIRARFENGELKPGLAGPRDFFDMLADKACGCTLNPLPFALEGNIQDFPDVDLVTSQLEIALATLKQALPHMKVWPESLYDPKQTKILIDGYHAYFLKGMEFLQIVAPSLMATTGKGKRRAAWAKIIQAAKDTGISLQHICVAITLSALTASQAFNPAKKVIKPAADYGRAAAYNAMWDLFLLFMLRKLQEEHRECRSALLTRDKNLALLWMGMKMVTSITEVGARSQIVFDDKLLMFDDEDLAFLQGLLGEGNIYYDRPLGE